MEVSNTVFNLRNSNNFRIDNHAMNKLSELLSDEEQSRLEKIIEKPITLYRGKHLFRQNGKFLNLYALRSGCVKNYINDQNGSERILGFSLPGEILGLDAIADRAHKYSAVVLEDASIYRIPYLGLKRLCSQVPHLQYNLFHLFSEELNVVHEKRSLYANRSAEEKLALFLLDFLERKHCIEDGKMELWLRMGRHDIANCLGLASETVSRVLTRLREEGTLEVENRTIRIRNYPQLRSIAYGADEFRGNRHELREAVGV